MKVRATKPGFIYGNLKAKGDEFTLVEKEVLDDKGKKSTKLSKEATERQFSSKWMEKV